ncbi:MULTISPECIES: hypothetical protein [Roseobacter]|uniref:hypothetical protein n=1 Tax=Roseobacter TaxID=2433 RepID=UPI000160F205|nr:MULTISPECIES: hypothetical protein [Roseobacter]
MGQPLGAAVLDTNWDGPVPTDNIVGWLSDITWLRPLLLLNIAVILRRFFT